MQDFYVGGGVHLTEIIDNQIPKISAGHGRTRGIKCQKCIFIYLSVEKGK